MIGEFATERLILRPATLDDVDLVQQLDTDIEVMRYITRHASSREESMTELARSIGARWMVSDTGEFLGWVGANATTDAYELGWRFRSSVWGRGYATEATRALVEKLFELGASRVFAQTMAVNTRSRAVMERVGLTYSRTFHLHFDDPLPGTELGEVEYELRRIDWVANTPPGHIAERAAKCLTVRQDGWGKDR